MTAWEVIISPPPPRPCTARPAISQPIVVALPATMDPATNTAIPTTKTRL